MDDLRPGGTGAPPMLEVVAAPIVSYAMAHGGIGFLHRVVVTLPAATGAPRSTAQSRGPRRGQHARSASSA